MGGGGGLAQGLGIWGGGGLAQGHGRGGGPGAANGGYRGMGPVHCCHRKFKDAAYIAGGTVLMIFVSVSAISDMIRIGPTAPISHASLTERDISERRMKKDFMVNV